MMPYRHTSRNIRSEPFALHQASKYFVDWMCYGDLRDHTMRHRILQEQAFLVR